MNDGRGSAQHHITDPSHSDEDGRGYLSPDQRHMGLELCLFSRHATTILELFVVVKGLKLVIKA